MKIENLKMLDRRLRLIPDPLGRGFQTLKKTLDEWAENYGTSVTELYNQYMAWKWRK